MPQYSVAIHEDADDLLEALIDFTASSGTVIPGAPGQIIQVYKFFLVAAVGTVLTFKDGSTPLSSIMVGADAGLVWDFDTKPWFTLGVGNDFIISSSATSQVSGRIYYNQGTATQPPSSPTDGLVAEDGVTPLIAEDGTTFLVKE